MKYSRHSQGYVYTWEESCQSEDAEQGKSLAVHCNQRMRIARELASETGGSQSRSRLWLSSVVTGEWQWPGAQQYAGGSLSGLGLPQTACRCLSLDLCAHLLVLAKRLLLTGQACSLFLVRLVRGRYLVGLRPCTTAHLTARPRGFVDESAARALPAHLSADGL